MFVIKIELEFILGLRDEDRKGYLKFEKGEVEMCADIKDAEKYNTKEQAEREKVLFMYGRKSKNTYSTQYERAISKIYNDQTTIEVLEVKEGAKEEHHKNGAIVSKTYRAFYGANGTLKDKVWFRTDGSQEKEEEYCENGELRSITYYREDGTKEQKEHYLRGDYRENGEIKFKRYLSSKNYYTAGGITERSEAYNVDGTLKSIHYYSENETRVEYYSRGKKIKTKYLEKGGTIGGIQHRIEQHE